MNYTSEQKRLAYEIADALNDHEAMKVHLEFAQRYQESFLRRILAKVMSIPEDKIRKSRGALYTSLVKQHGGSSGAWD